MPNIRTALTSVFATVITGTALMLGGAGQAAAADRAMSVQQATQDEVPWTGVKPDALVDALRSEVPWT